jgi:hypothetical protein
LYPYSPEEALARVMDGSSWSDFCDLLKAAGAVLDRDGSPRDPLSRAEGLRYLSRLTRAGLEAFVEYADPHRPELRRMVHETVKMGADNPDNHYHNAEIDGAATYRITGARGTVQYLEFAVQKGSYGEARGMPPTGHLDGKDLALDAEGRFEIWLCPHPRGANWLRTEPGSGTVIVRQSRLDPATETFATLRIERVLQPGEVVPPSELTPLDIDRGLTKTGMLVVGASQMFAEWAEGFHTHHPNALPRFDQALSDRMGGVPHIVYHHSAWRLGPDEVLVIDAPPVACDHWNFQLENHWMESLDYRHFRIHLNSKTAVYAPDGSVRIVVAHTDPGHPNWLQTAGHAHGAMCFRWVRPESHDPPAPTCRVMKRSELA